jgi:hypothetical protein
MIDSIVAVGDKLHVITRRRWEDDLRRHFAGTVVATSGDLCELEGYVFVFDSPRNEYRRQPDVRRRILAVSDADYIVNRVPRQADLSLMVYHVVDGELVATTGPEFELNINEFGPRN